MTYGVIAMILLIKPPPGTESFIDRWVVAVGLAIVVGTGLLYMVAAHPYRHSDDIGEGDAIEIAEKLRAMRRP